MSNSAWSDHDVRKIAAKYALEAMAARSPVETRISDDTGFLKQGNQMRYFPAVTRTAAAKR